MALKKFIDKFIKNGKLVHFLGEQRMAAPPGENYVWVVNYHDHQDVQQ